MPATIHFPDGSRLDVQDSIAEAKRKKAHGTWQSFITTLGNPCKVNCSTIEKVTAVRE